MRILIADDHPDIRLLLAKTVAARSNFEVVGEAAHGAKAVEKVAELEPDLVIMDIDMPVMNGVEATRAIRERFPRVAVLAFTATGDMTLVEEMLQAGACGYVLKSNMTHELSYYLGALPQRQLA